MDDLMFWAYLFKICAITAGIIVGIGILKAIKGAFMREWMREPEEDRPVIDYCPVCHEPFYGESLTQYGDDGYELDGFFIHSDCIREYMEQYKVG